MRYEYRCAAGHVTEHDVKLDLSNAPTACPLTVGEGHYTTMIEQDGKFSIRCNAPLERVMSLTAPFFPGAGTWNRG